MPMLFPPQEVLHSEFGKEVYNFRHYLWHFRHFGSQDQIFVWVKLEILSVFTFQGVYVQGELTGR